MQVISSTDFQDWTKHPVTVSFMNSVQARVEDAKENLATSAGQCPEQDNFLRGFIHGQREILGVTYDDVEEK